MGQYYKPVNLKTKEHLYSHDYGNGLKLMEHSYIGNEFVEAVEGLLMVGGAWHKDAIVWAGDYADAEKTTFGITPDDEGVMPNIWSLTNVEGEKIQPARIMRSKMYRYLCNHTQKLYVDLNAIEPMTQEWARNADGKAWHIHPLPLLTAEGNGRGGGDYRGSRMDEIGSWARNSISIERKKPEGYAEINGTFIEA